MRGISQTRGAGGGGALKQPQGGQEARRLSVALRVPGARALQGQQDSYIPLTPEHEKGIVYTFSAGNVGDQTCMVKGT